MNLTKLDPNDVKSLRTEFPKEAIEVYRELRDTDTGEVRKLVGYKAQYVIERLNDVFGHIGWGFEITEKEVDGTDVAMRGKLTIYKITDKGDKITSAENTIIKEPLIVRENWGTAKTNKYMPKGEAYKSASTDALKKCASMLDIGHEAYKGLERRLENSTSPDYDTKNSDTKQKLKETCIKYNIKQGGFKVLCNTVLKEEKKAADLTEEEMQKLINHLEKHGAPV